MFRLAAPGLRPLSAALSAALVALWLLAPRRLSVGARHEPQPHQALRRLTGMQLVTCNTTAGTIQIKVHTDWAPIGAARFLRLVHCGFYDGCAIFRAIPNFLAQFGVSPDGGKNRAWRSEGEVQDDPLRPDIPFKTGTVAFAGYGENSRGTQVFFTFSDHTSLGKRPWEVPFAQVEGAASLAALKRIQTKYGDNVDQGKLWHGYGYEYLRTNFPGLTYINSCTVAGGGFSMECPAAPLSSLTDVLEVPGMVAERFGVPVPVVLLALVAIVGIGAVFLCQGMMRPIARPYAGQAGSPYMGQQYRRVMQ